MLRPADYASVFKLTAGIFEKTGAAHLLIGGYAVNQYNVSRQTADVDFMVAAGDFELVLEQVTAAGYKIESRQEAFVQLIPDGPAMGIDFMLVEKDTLNTMLSRSRNITIAGCNFSIPALNDLLALKLHSIKHNPFRMSRDLPDIVSLLSANGIAPDSDEFRDLCHKFGTGDIYNRICGDFHGK